MFLLETRKPFRESFALHSRLATQFPSTAQKISTSHEYGRAVPTNDFERINWRFAQRQLDEHSRFLLDYQIDFLCHLFDRTEERVYLGVMFTLLQILASCWAT